MMERTIKEPHPHASHIQTDQAEPFTIYIYTHTYIERERERTYMKSNMQSTQLKC